MEWGYLPESYPNPAKLVKRNDEYPKERRVEFYEFPALAAAINNCPKPRIRMAIKLFLYTGLRSSKLVKLEWAWVKLNRKVIEIPGQFYKTK